MKTLLIDCPMNHQMYDICIFSKKEESIKEVQQNLGHALCEKLSF
jgi:hypothetical protein